MHDSITTSTIALSYVVMRNMSIRIGCTPCLMGQFSTESG